MPFESELAVQVTDVVIVVVAPGLTVEGEPLAEDENVGDAAVPAGTTKSVMLRAGRVAEKLVPPKLMLERRLIAFADVSCQGSARPALVKPARLTVTGVVPDRYFERTMMVRALSDDRWAAKAATVSGFGPVAETLVSPNVDLFP